MGGFIEKEWLETHRGELERLRGVADELDTIAAVAQNYGNGDVDEAEVLASRVDDENEGGEETDGRRLQPKHHRRRILRHWRNWRNERDGFGDVDGGADIGGISPGDDDFDVFLVSDEHFFSVDEDDLSVDNGRNALENDGEGERRGEWVGVA